MPTSTGRMIHRSSATTFRTCVGALMYLANDVPHAQHVIWHLATNSSQPAEKSLTVLRHLVAYGCCHTDIRVSLNWGGQAAGIYHDYPDVSPNEHVLEVFTDEARNRILPHPNISERLHSRDKTLHVFLVFDHS